MLIVRKLNRKERHFAQRLLEKEKEKEKKKKRKITANLFACERKEKEREKKKRDKIP